MYDNTTNTCGCTGPRPGEPVCPCKMKNLRQVDGRWVEVRDHGPVGAVNEGEDMRKLLSEAFNDRQTD